MDDKELLSLTLPFVCKAIGRTLTDEEGARLLAALPDIKPRVQRLTEIAEAAHFYFERIVPDEKALKLLSSEAKGYLSDLADQIKMLPVFSHESLEEIFRKELIIICPKVF